MKIVHCCLSNFYIDGYSYQENMLIKKHVDASHDVLVLASTETFGDDKKIAYLQPSEYIGEEGAKVVRLSYRSFLPMAVMKKLRMHPDVYRLLERFKPDVIMFHGMCGFELLTVARYVKNNPSAKFYADSHEDFNNSARTLLAINSLYRFFYNPIIFLAKNYIDKVLYITLETKEFCKKVYKLAEDQLEFFPLGGVVLNDEEYGAVRTKKRSSYSIDSEDVVFLQTGKFDKKKKLIESIAAFSKTKNDNFRYYIAGSVAEELKEEFNCLIRNDKRVYFIGWVESDALIALLCMADVYVQPGSQSATMQMSLAARCAVILDDVPSHRHVFCENGFLVKSNRELEDAFDFISKTPFSLAGMHANSYSFAKKHLDYSILAERLTK